ncbi:MAG: FecR domain-containing protein [Bacteriovoracia bacterium]
MTYFRLILLLATVLVASVPPAGADAAEERIFAVVSKVEGSGNARVRREAGTESVVGEQMEIYAGDRIFTDDTSTVDILLQDGTIIRVGIRSEFTLNEVNLQAGILSWVFGLAHGTVRSLIEKSPDKKTTRLRINTPAGTMGVRGTEVLLEHQKESGLTSIFTLEGQVDFGARGCQETKKCLVVGAGKFSRIKSGERQPAPAASFTMKQVLSLPTPAADSVSAPPGTVGGGNKESAEVERLALFQGISRANAGLLAGMDEAALSRTVKGAQENMQNAQDQFLGRTAEIREAMYAAMREGTFEKVLKVAESYETVKNGKAPVDDPAEKLTFGPLAVKKFALGKAVIESSAFNSNATGVKPATKEQIEVATANKAPAAKPVLGPEVAALVSQSSDALKKASEWAQAVEVKTAALKGNSEVAVDPYKTYRLPTTSQEKAVVQTAEIAQETRVRLSSVKSGSCNILCSIAKFFSGDTKSSANTKTSKTATATAPRASAKMATCAHPITTCTYQPCDTRTGKICKQEKICKQTCQ